MNVLKYFEGWGKFSIFWRNSWVLKVLAHEVSDEPQKNYNFSIFNVWWREVLIQLSQDKRLKIFCGMAEIFNFWMKFLSFKGVSPRNEWRNPKNLNSSSFKVWWREILIQDSQDEHCGIIWGMGEIFNFWTKFLSFKDVSPRNEWRNPKILKNFNFQCVMNGGINKTFPGWTSLNILRDEGNFQDLDEILEF